MTYRVGITGFAMSGKDIAADGLKELGFVKVGMSTALMRDIVVLNPPIEDRNSPCPDCAEGEFKSIRLSTILQRMSYDEAKAAYPDFRELLQRYGTDVHREINPDYWVQRRHGIIEALDLELVVTTGIRFWNEFYASDLVIAIERPGVGPVNSHVSDAEMQDIIDAADVHVINDGTMLELQDTVRGIVEADMREREILQATR